MMIRLTLGLSSKGLPTFALEHVSGAAIKKGHVKEHILGETLDVSDPPTNIELIDPYKHRYDTVYLPGLFGGGVQIRVVS